VKNIVVPFKLINFNISSVIGNDSFTARTNITIGAVSDISVLSSNSKEKYLKS